MKTTIAERLYAERECRRAIVRDALEHITPDFGVMRLNEGKFLTLKTKNYLFVFKEIPCSDNHRAHAISNRVYQNKNKSNGTRALLYVWQLIQDGKLPQVGFETKIIVDKLKNHDSH